MVDVCGGEYHLSRDVGAGHLRHRARLIAGVMCCGFLLAGGHCAAATAHRAAGGRAAALPHGSFVVEPIRTVEDLTRQVARRPEVARRYARLLHIAPESVSMALASLHVTTLAAAVDAEVYYCHPGARAEAIGYRPRRLPRGTVVFAFDDGTPVVIRACGNPTRALRPRRTPPPKVAVNTVLETPLVAPAPVELPEFVPGDAEFSIMDDFHEIALVDEDIRREGDLLASNLFTPPVDNAYEWARSERPSLALLAGWLDAAGAGGLGAVAAVTGSRSSGGTGGTPPVTRPPVIAAVPEASPFLLFGLGTLALGAYCCRRARKRGPDPW
jgi:hypothetical protein